MGFFDNLKETISTGSAKVAEKAKEGYGIASLTASLEKEKATAEKLYKEAAKKAFAADAEAFKALAPEEVEKLVESLAKIDEIKASLRATKGVQVCPGCGKEVDKDIAFCPACGAKMPEVVKEEEPAEEAAEAPAEESTNE